MEQAARFLLDDIVRDAPLEQKRSFLQSKGLSVDEIDRLLQASVVEKPSNATAEDKTQIPEVKEYKPVNIEAKSMLTFRAVYSDCIISERRNQKFRAAIFNSTFSNIPGDTAHYYLSGIFASHSKTATIGHSAKYSHVFIRSLWGWSCRLWDEQVFRESHGRRSQLCETFTI